MEKYWKLLNIEDGKYSIHETEEEVNHIIEYITRDLSDDKVTKRINIETPLSNYDFQFVYVFDEHHIHQFLYFFDTIEEELDSRDDDRYEAESLKEENERLFSENKQLKEALAEIRNFYTYLINWIEVIISLTE